MVLLLHKTWLYSIHMQNEFSLQKPTILVYYFKSTATQGWILRFVFFLYFFFLSSPNYSPNKHAWQNQANKWLPWPLLNLIYSFPANQLMPLFSTSGRLIRVQEFFLNRVKKTGKLFFFSFFFPSFFLFLLSFSFFSSFILL